MLNTSLPIPSPIVKCYTSANGNFVRQPSVTYVQVCSDESSINNQVLFPTSFIQAFKPINADKESSKSSAIMLSEGKDYVIPNTSSSTYFEAQLYAITGAKINITLERGTSKSILRTSNLKPGVYLLRVNTDSKLETFRIIVQ